MMIQILEIILYPILGALLVNIPFIIEVVIDVTRDRIEYKACEEHIKGESKAKTRCRIVRGK